MTRNYKKNYDLSDMRAIARNVCITCNREKRDKVTLEEITKMLKSFGYPTSSLERDLNAGCEARYLGKEESYYFCTKPRTKII